MTISEEARELQVKERQKAENTQQNMLERTEEQIKQKVDHPIDNQAREVATENRQHLEQIQNNMLERTEEQIQG